MLLPSFAPPSDIVAGLFGRALCLNLRQHKLLLRRVWGHWYHQHLQLACPVQHPEHEILDGFKVSLKLETRQGRIPETCTLPGKGRRGFSSFPCLLCSVRPSLSLPLFSRSFALRLHVTRCRTKSSKGRKGATLSISPVLENEGDGSGHPCSVRLSRCFIPSFWCFVFFPYLILAIRGGSPSVRWGGDFSFMFHFYAAFYVAGWWARAC